MKKANLYIAALFLIAGTAAAVPAPAESVQTQVIALLISQTQAWNKGNLPAFMQGYWQSSETEYVGASGIVQGWEAIQERYQRTYQHGKSMGHLRFKNLQVTMLAPGAALAVGEYVLQSGKSGDKVSQGIFTLVLRRFPEGWRIINDHTSALAGKP